MIVVIGKNSGFCFGVKRAVNNALSLKGENNYVLGELIHNEQVNTQLEQNGLRILKCVDDIDFQNNETVLVRTHGEPKSTFDFLSLKKVKVIDCTCPFVKDIQNKVYEHYNNGFKIVIIGKPEHPEVKGINGWCNNSALICENGTEIERLTDKKICIVVQTTYSEQKFKEIIKNFNYDRSKTVDIFNTICYTTTKRQNEAEIISKKCQAMLVIGGANSNNTDKLFEICKRNCQNVFRIIDPIDFDYNKIKQLKKVGIVLGASTPIEQFQEVVSSMEKVTEEIIKTETVESEIEEENVAPATKKVVESKQKSEMETAFDKIKPSKDFRIGQIVSAKISSANDEGLMLSLDNAKNDIALPKDEMLKAYDKEDYKDKIGETIKVMVVGKKPIKFSEKAMEKVLKEEAEIAEIKDGKIFESKIIAVNKGGLTGKYGSYDVFVPASQIRIGFVKDLDKYVNKTLRLKAEKVESKGSRRQIVGSQRVILEAEKAERDAIKLAKEEEFFSSVDLGDVVLGTPVRFAAFGAFIEVNGFDCLAHISDLSWTGCKDCAEVLEIGKEYEFKILKIDKETKRVSLGYKQLQPKPWDLVADKYHVGDVIKGNVVRIVSFGAFVEVEKGIDGLVHVSQISNEYVENPLTALQVGQEVEAKIIDIKPENEKMTLSIKALLPEVPKPEKIEKEDAKGKKRDNKEDENVEEELHEWKDTDNGDVSIAEMLGNLDK